MVILAGNTLVCVAFYRNRKLRTKTNYYLVSLAVADIMVGVFSVPYWVYLRLGKYGVTSVSSMISSQSKTLQGLESLMINRFTPNSASSKIDNFQNYELGKIKQHHSNVLLNSFPTNGYTLGFCPQNQKLENSSLWIVRFSYRLSREWDSNMNKTGTLTGANHRFWSLLKCS